MVTEKPGPLAVGVQILRSRGRREALLRSVLPPCFCRRSTPPRGWICTTSSRRGGQNGGGLPLHRKIAAGLLSGGISAAMGNPADMAMVRMQAHGRLPLAERHNYKSVGDTI
jgi:solute carrier family 25 (mitochondrial oxoglutarate transporter), member 11